MSLEEAIKHLEEELEIKEDWSCVACKEDHQQLLEWLKELQAIKSTEPSEALKWLERYRMHILFNTNVVEDALLKAQEDEKLKIDICEMFGLDNLFPYNDNKAILKELEEYMDRYNQLWVDFMKTSKQLKKQEKAVEIIKKKYVHIPQLLCAFENQLEEANPLETYYNGQVGINVPMPLTEEEFDVLKEVLWDEQRVRII